MWNGAILALQFLTVLPIRREVEWNDETARWAVRSFPLVGALFGGLLVGQYWLLDEWVSPLFLSLWLMFFSVFFAGGLHADGWMDCSDAYFSYRDILRRQEIMSDSRVGAFAVLSVFFLFGFRIVFMYETLPTLSWQELFFIPFLSRTFMALLLLSAPLAKQTGMAATFRAHVKKSDRWGIGLFLFVAFISFFSLFLLMAMIVFFFLARSFIVKQFGGVTGDVLGAFIEGSETYLWFVMWLLHLFVMG
jgi:adenosylcobinamide-GDP ribazoletransferase